MVGLAGNRVELLGVHGIRFGKAPGCLRVCIYTGYCTAVTAVGLYKAVNFCIGIFSKMLPSLALAVIASKLDHYDAAKFRCVSRSVRDSVSAIKKPYWALGVGDLLVFAGLKMGTYPFVQVQRVMNKNTVRCLLSLDI